MGGIASQGSIFFRGRAVGREETVIQSETAPLALIIAESEGHEHLEKKKTVCGVQQRTWEARRTYFNRGRIVRAQMMQLTPPITSSVEGTGPVGAQMPLSTYKGEVPISL